VCKLKYNLLLVFRISEIENTGIEIPEEADHYLHFIKKREISKDTEQGYGK
jgi:hypothetical protein